MYALQITNVFQINPVTVSIFRNLGKARESPY